MKATTLLEALELTLPEVDLPSEVHVPQDPQMTMLDERADDLYRYSRSGPGGKHQHIVVSN